MQDRLRRTLNIHRTLITRTWVHHHRIPETRVTIIPTSRHPPIQEVISQAVSPTNMATADTEPSPVDMAERRVDSEDLVVLPVVSVVLPVDLADMVVMADIQVVMDNHKAVASSVPAM